MHITIKAKNIVLTSEIKEQVTKKMNSLDKVLRGQGEGEALITVELGRMSNHHKSGDVFEADCSIHINGKNFYNTAEGSDLSGVIEDVREKLFNELEKYKDRRQTLFKRGATSIKKMMKGLSRRNPFTSRYD